MKRSYLLILAFLTSNIAIAKEEEHREHDAHEHGHATLSVIVEKNELLLALETPAMNVFGFEHEPKNEEQHKIVDVAVKDLENFASLAIMDANAECSVTKTEVKQPFSDDHKDEHDDDHKDEHKQDEHKDDDHKDEHKHDEHEDDHKEAVHSDVDVEVSYTCKNPANLKQMDLTSLFKRFPLFEELDVQGIINGKQSASELNKEQPVFSLKN